MSKLVVMFLRLSRASLCFYVLWSVCAGQAGGGQRRVAECMQNAIDLAGSMHFHWRHQKRCKHIAMRIHASIALT